MYVQTRTEVRTTRPLFIENPTANIVSIKEPGWNVGIVTQALRIKVTALSNGKVSVKGLGKGGFPAVHLSGSSRMVMEGERSVSLRDFIWLYQDSGLNLAVVLP